MPNHLYAAASPMRTPMEAQEMQEMQMGQEMWNMQPQRGAMALGEPVARFTPQEGLEGPGMAGSMQEALSDNLGLYAVCEFVVGTQEMETKEGILYSVGRSFVVLYDEIHQNFILCDVFSIKFVTLYTPGHRPWNMTRTPTVPMVNVPGVGTVPAGPYGIGTGSIPHLQNSPLARGNTMVMQGDQGQ